MALGRARNTKRSSSNSFASTITTIVFIALCVLGVWMLSSNSVISPQTTGRTSTSTSSTSSSSASTNVASFLSSNEPQVTKLPDEKESLPRFEDNPGYLPDDAIKSDDQRSQVGEANKFNDPRESSVVKETAQLSEESSLTQNQQVSQVSDENKEFQKSDEISQESESNSKPIKEDNPQNAIPEIQEVADHSLENSQEAHDDQKPHDHDQDHQHQLIENPTKNDESQNVGDGINQQQRREEQQKPLEQQEEQQKPPAHQEEQQKPPEQQEERQKPPEQQEGQQKPPEQQEEPQKTPEVEGQQKTVEENQPSKHQYEDVTSHKQVALYNEVATSNQTQESQKSKQTGNQDQTAKQNGGVLDTSGIPKESKESKKSWATQAAQSENEKERRKDKSDSKGSIYGYTWQLCNNSAGADYIPCLDNEKALKKLRSTRHFEHRERHCPEEGPTCLVPLPQGYKRPIKWPQSRDKIWYHNVPHTLLAEVKGHQNWVKVTGEFLTFPGGGTQFIHGALHYIDFLQNAVPNIAWGKNTRVILDVGCGVASFGGFLFERDVLAMSFAPKDEHEAQVQFALERGIPAISAVMGSQRLPFPSNVFDLLHCARCRVPWHLEGGLLLLELNRVLRPGGYFVWSATPVYQKLQEDVEIWKAMSSLTASMCWELITIKKDKLNRVGAAIYRKPASNECYDKRKQKSPPMCKGEDDPNAAWYVPLQACMHRVPSENTKRGSRWPKIWPARLYTPSYWLNGSQMGIYGKLAPQDFSADYEHWKRVVNNTYMGGLGINLSNVRNCMDMRSVYGGFAAALKDLKVWVLNVVNVDSPDTLPIIYERGLFGIYHDWCESFSTYPRTYDLLHADHLFSKLKKRCKLAPVMAEVDRIVRPGGKLIVRDESGAIGEVENLLKSLHWEVHLTFSKNQEGMLSAQKGDWRPEIYAKVSEE